MSGFECLADLIINDDGVSACDAGYGCFLCNLSQSSKGRRTQTPSKLSKDRQQRAHSAKLTHSERSYCHAPQLSANAPSLSAALPVRVVRRDRPEPERPMWVPFVGPKRTKASCSRRQRSIGSVPRRHRPDQRVFARLPSCLCFPARPTFYPGRSPSSG
jgi:hypothetical protein